MKNRLSRIDLGYLSAAMLVVAALAALALVIYGPPTESGAAFNEAESAAAGEI